MKKKISLLFILALLANCGTASEMGKVLRNEKTKTTDEFLVKKNEALSQPPDFKTLPAPNSLKNPPAAKNSGELSLKNIMNENKKINNNKTNKSLEQSILNEIRK